MKNIASVLVIIIPFLISVPAEAQTLTVLHNFSGADGSIPWVI